MSQIQEQPTYGKDYLSWKSWGLSEEFASFDRDYETYSLAELKKTGIGQVKRVLEIGFGNGSFLGLAKKHNWQAVGTEENLNLIQVAKERGFEVFHTAELAKIEKNSFDLVVAFDVLEHIEQKDLVGFFQQIKGWLTDDGVFLARFPNGDSPFGLSLQNGDITHVTALGRGKVEYFAKCTGLNIRYFGGTAQPIFVSSLMGTLKRMVVVSLKNMMESFFRNFFFSKSKINFTSPNLVVVFEKSQR